MRLTRIPRLTLWLLAVFAVPLHAAVQPGDPIGSFEITRFEVEGDVTFGAGVVAVGEVRVAGPRHVPDGEVLGR